MIIRGGTSKGVFFLRDDLPDDMSERDRIIMRIMASGEPAQVDGLGCALPHTSKIMIVQKSSKKGIDLEYLFGQVGIKERFIDYTGNCGNLTSAVGPFAIESGIIKPKEPLCRVAMLNLNTGKRIDEIIECNRDGVNYAGDYKIDGVKIPGSRIKCIWHNPSGALTGSLLPTGNRADDINIDGKDYEISIVDSGNPAVFIKADSLGLSGKELPGEISSDKLELLERIRSIAAAMIGMAKNPEDATSETPHLPFIMIVAPTSDYVDSLGNKIEKESHNILARMFSMQRMHHAFAVSGAIALASAALIKGTVANKVSDNIQNNVIIGHPRGLIEIEALLSEDSSHPDIKYAVVSRTARLLMSGYAYY